jgi:hypothetical protein
MDRLNPFFKVTPGFYVKRSQIIHAQRAGGENSLALDCSLATWVLDRSGLGKFSRQGTYCGVLYRLAPGTVGRSGVPVAAPPNAMSKIYRHE